MNNLAPIVVFVYNRVEHTKLTIEKLKENLLAKESNLYIFSDGPKKESDIEKIEEIRKYINNISGFKSIKIIESEKNKGLAKSVIYGVSNIIKEYGKVIVVEDDLITAKNFLNFMNDCLNFYEKDDKIWSISGYKLPIKIPFTYKNSIYLTERASSWGWATWSDRWLSVDWDIKDYMNFIKNKNKVKEFERGGHDLCEMLSAQMNGKIDSWAIRWCYNQYKQGKFTIFPVKSLVQNIGLDGSGTHSSVNDYYHYNTMIDENFKYKLIKNISLNRKISKISCNYYSNTLKDRIKRKIIRFLIKLK